MKRVLFGICFLFALVQPCFAYHIEILQVSKIAPYDDTYKNFMSELAKAGIIEKKNLIIKRTIIDADADASIWEKVGILLKIKLAASRIVDAKPNLVVTVGTVATKYSKDKIIGAGIPVVFTCVANPLLLGCPEVDKPLPGLTGATLYQDPLNLLVLAQMAKQNIKTVGIVHSDDDNAIAFTEESKKKATQLGITIYSKEVKKSDSIIPAATELIKAGVDSFVIPLDAYYALRNLQPAKDIIALSREKKIPVFTFANFNEKGAVLYVGPEFGYMGTLAAQLTIKILIEGKRPEQLPILKQEELNIYIDMNIVKEFGLEVAPKLLEIAHKR